jgi:UDP-2,3-diacylglucosamine pyrophosphatase LpxH
MLAIISDLHLCDGTSGSTISPGAFVIFAERLRELAFAASFRSDGRYRPVAQVDLVLLGDVLDVIRSARWLEGASRPWDTPHDGPLAGTVGKITSDILEHNWPALQILRGLAHEGAVRIPPASAGGQVAQTSEPLPVPVRIYYMVGNHDWFYHVRGPAYDALRRSIIGAMGLAHAGEGPFPHDPDECPELKEALQRHRVFARHGDIYDPFNFEQDRDASSLGDCVVIELLNRFGVEVHRQLGQELPSATLQGLRELDNVRPLLIAPVWIDGLLERTCAFPAQRKLVKQVWDKLVDEFLSLQFIRQRDTWNPCDLVDGLQRALKFSQRVSISWASWIMTWLRDMACPGAGSLYPQALTERDFRNRRARHIVYGHTHQAQCVPLDASYSESGVLNQMYFNSGTWRRVYRQTQFAPAEHEFIAADEMTFLVFFQGDERKGRPYETWSGTLGIEAPQATYYRVDAGGIGHAGSKPFSAPGVPGHRPHFALPAAPAGQTTRSRLR